MTVRTSIALMNLALCHLSENRRRSATASDGRQGGLTSHRTSPRPAASAPTLLAVGMMVLSLQACGGNDNNDPTIQPVTANVVASPLSATEADRFLTVVPSGDGRYYAAGFTTVQGDQAMTLARLTAQGQLDPTFGQGGVATVNVAVKGKTAELVRGIAVQSDGKIVISGPIEHDVAATGNAAKDTDVALARFTSSGVLDTTFGTNGIVTMDFGPGLAVGTSFLSDTAWGLTALPGDELLLIGAKRADAVGREDTDYVVVKLSPLGVPVPSFGTNGFVTVDVGRGNDMPRTALVQADGKYVVSGHTSDAGVVTTVLFRLLPTGALDSSFGTGGIANVALTATVGEAYDVAAQGDNFVIAGYGRDATSGTVDIISARFLANGAWDKTYGDNGLAMIDLAGQDDRSRALKTLADGRVVIVGQAKPSATSQDAAIVLLTKDGKRDASLNGNGIALFDFGGGADAFFGLALSSDRTKAVAVGWKGVPQGEVNASNNDDARTVVLTVPGV